MRRTRVSI
ncbi:hypothetical protein ECNE037_2754, partial [Escherichia coli NE037]